MPRLVPDWPNVTIPTCANQDKQDAKLLPIATQVLHDQINSNESLTTENATTSGRTAWRLEYWHV
jgi:hypothetical protein